MSLHAVAYGQILFEQSLVGAYALDRKDAAGNLGDCLHPHQRR